MQDISRATNDLAEIADHAKEKSYLVARFDDSGQGFILEANEEGLIVLASALLELATKATKGAHFHLDANSYLDEADCSLIIVKT